MNSERTLRGYKLGTHTIEEAMQAIQTAHRTALRAVASGYVRLFGGSYIEARYEALAAAWQMLEDWDPDLCPQYSKWISNGHLYRKMINRGREVRGLKRKGNDWSPPELLDDNTPEDVSADDFFPAEERKEPYSTLDETDLAYVQGDVVKKDLLEGFVTEGRYGLAIEQTSERFPDISPRKIRKSAWELRRDLAHRIKKRYPALAEGRTQTNKKYPRRLNLKFRRP